MSTTIANGQSCFHRVYPGIFWCLDREFNFSLAPHSIDTLETKTATVSKTKVNELPKSGTADDQQVKQMPDYKAMTKIELTVRDNYCIRYETIKHYFNVYVFVNRHRKCCQNTE